MLRKLVSAFTAYLQAWQMIRQYRLWGYLAIPGLISLTILILAFAGVYHFSPQIGDWLFDWMGVESDGFWKNLASVVIGMAMIFLGLISYKYLVQILVLPFMGPLSERVEQILTGDPPESFRFDQYLADVARGLLLSIRNICIELFWVVLLSIAGWFVPVVGSILSTALIFVIQAYYAGFGNLDYTLERRRYNIRQSITWVAQHRAIAIGNGAGFLLLLLIPVFGAVLAPALGTIAATLIGAREIPPSRP